ncbi:MAG: (2Fe-2S)-binding protein [Clostridiales bacterium]|nr:(2Fe-2S)-binding protein [Clostridiales bacterium]
MSQVLKFTCNNEVVEVLIDPEVTLLDVLRDKLGVMSPKCGCNHGDCGACTVMVDGVAVKSCIMLAATVEGKNILTVEGLSKGQELHPIQKAFIELGAPQCGHCTPGMVMAAKSFLDKNPNPTYEEVKEALAGNLCRCTGYTKYVDAVMEVAKGTFGNL